MDTKIMEFVHCGYVKSNGDFTEVYYNDEVGELIYMEGDSGVYYTIGEVEVDEVSQVENPDQFIKAIKAMDFYGLIITPNEALVLIDDNKLERRPLINIKDSTGVRYTIDMDIEATLD